MNKPLVSIIILTRNPGKSFKKILDQIFGQDLTSFEVIVIDSGSTDGTGTLVKKYPIKFISLDAHLFGHGKTRNYGCTFAKGKYVVFLTHDAVPKSSLWLKELIEPFKHKRVAAVFGRQFPKPGEKTLDKIFFTILYGDKEIVWEDGKYAQGDNIFSDANSAIRKDLLLANPYKDDIIVSEDYEWANRVMKLGYKIVYQPSAAVIHSHSYSLTTLFKRNFDIGVSYREISNFNNTGSFVNKGLGFLINEVKYLKRLSKLHLLPQVITRDGIRFIAINLGKKEAVIPKSIKRKYLSAQDWYWV